MTQFVRTLLSASLLCMLLAATGCTSGPAEPTAQPKIAPPAIKTAGELAVGVDLELPPFAGTDEGQQAGLDVDIASALAERLGLAVRFVDVKPSDAATALADGTVDVVMSVPLSDATYSALSLAGVYAYDGPAFFVSTGSTASVEPSLTLAGIQTLPVGAQQGSESLWMLGEEFDPEDVRAFESIKAAFDALVAGEVPLIAGDAFVGAYLMRDMPGVHFAGQLKPATPLGAAVAADNEALGDAVRETLDALAADGVLAAVRGKWVGSLPELEALTSGEETATP